MWWLILMLSTNPTGMPSAEPFPTEAACERALRRAELRPTVLHGGCYYAPVAGLPEVPYPPTMR